MTVASAELQKAIFETLTGDTELCAMLGGARIFDTVPANSAFPYVSFGKTSIFDWSTATEDGSEHLFTLHAWSKKRGKKEIYAIMDALRKRLDQAPLTLAAHHLVNLRFEFADIGYDENQAVHRGLLRFRAVTEPAI